MKPAQAHQEVVVDVRLADEAEAHEAVQPEPFEAGRVQVVDEAAPVAAPKRDFGTAKPEVEKREVGDGVEAEFMLESSAVCPHCLEDINKVQIVRMLRTKVNFVSSLPRRGQLLICPKCRIALAGALGGLI